MKLVQQMVKLELEWISPPLVFPGEPVQSRWLGQLAKRVPCTRSVVSCRKLSAQAATIPAPSLDSAEDTQREVEAPPVFSLLVGVFPQIASLFYLVLP